MIHRMNRAACDEFNDQKSGQKAPKKENIQKLIASQCHKKIKA